MHAELSNGKLLNTVFTEDVQQGYHDKKVVVIYLTNGTKIIEKFNTESEAEEEVAKLKEVLKSGGGLTQKDTFADFPETGNAGNIYIAKDTGQTYYWDNRTKTYIKTGIAGRTGVYSYNGELPTTVGSDTTINKTDLEVIVAPTVPYSEGSEVSAPNAVHALIISSTTTTVTVKTITDMTIDSFRQVATLNDLPATGVSNILYAVKNIKEFRVWNSTNNEYEAFPVKPTGADNDQIHVTVSESNEIEAELQEHSVSEDYLTTELATKINNKVDKAVATDTSNKLVGAIATTQSGDNIVITKTKVDVTDNTSSTETTTITSSDDSIDLEVTSVVGGKQINLIGTTVTGVEAGLVDTTDPHNPVIQHDATKQNISDIKRFNNVFAFDGVEKTFTFPNTIDLDHLDHIFINGVLMEKGASNDYTINKTNRTITFTLAWEAKDKSYVTCE